MPRNLSNGFVFKDERSGHWRAAISWQDEDGRQRRMTRNTPVACYPDRVSRKTGKVTRDNRGKGAAEDFLGSEREEVEEDEKLSGTVSCETPVYRYVLDYIDMKESTGDILASAADGYRWYAKHLLGTELGKTPVGQVTARQIQGFSATWCRTATAATPSHTHVLLKTAFIRARRLVIRRPLRPCRRSQEAHEADKLLDAASVSRSTRRSGASPTRSPPPCSRAHDGDEAGRDMRPQVAGRRPRVTQDPGLAPLTRANSTFALSTPKTRSSARTIPYGDELARVLRRGRAHARRARCDGPRLGRGALRRGQRRRRRLEEPDGAGAGWRAFVRVARLVGSQGEPPRFPDLRHTFATMAIGSGVDVKTVSAILGHSTRR